MVPEINNYLRTVFAHNTDDKVEKKDALCNFVCPPEVLVSALFDSALDSSFVGGLRLTAK